MTDGEHTGVRDEHYNLVSVLYHTLQEGDTIDRYINDAEQAGDDQLKSFFQNVKQENKQRSDKAKQLLLQRLG